MKSPWIPVVLAFVACTRGSAISSSHEPVPQGPSRDSLAVAAAAKGDSNGLARLISSSCTEADKTQCYESMLAAPASKGYVKVAMGALDQLGVDPEIRRTGHMYAHAIGIAAGTGQRDITRTFTQCSEAYQSGCYHGVIQAWFAPLDSLSATDANALCAPFRQRESDRWLRFQCVHGMGHGLTMLFDHDLPKGLAGCDLLTDWWDQHSCYSGAFMENIVNVTTPHHPASALAHHHDMEGMEGMDHDMSSMDHGAKKFKAVDSTDMLYPCSIMAERYLSACYEMQTSVMLYNNKGDIAGAGRACETTPQNLRTICFASLGRDVSSYSQQNHKEAIRMCSLATPKYQPWCYYGLVKNFIDIDARPADGMSLCREVPSVDSKAVCYSAVGEQILVLRPDEAARRAACSSAEPEFLDACLYGARLAQVPAMLTKVWASVK